MQHRRFKDLGIVSAQKPKNTHLFIETSDGTLWLADSVDAAKLYYSTDKGDNWTLKTTRVDKIKMFYYDRINERVYAVDGTTADASSSRQFYIDTTDKSITEGDLAGGNDEMLDIIWDGTRAFSIKFNRIGAGAGEVDFFAREFNSVFSDSHATGDIFDAKNYDMTPGIVISGFYWFLYWHEDNNNVELWKYEIANNGWTKMETSTAGIKISTNKSQQGFAYDGSDVLYFVLYDTGDSKHYLYTYIITTDTLTKKGVYNISLMLDRNNSAITPNEFEKGFSIGASETVYEIKARRGGIRILQNMADITDAVIIAITDNFLMNNDGDMFEFQDVTSEISTIFYNDGIIGVEKKGTFTIHPDFHINWSKGDSIKIYDNNDVLEFHGLITDKNRNRKGIYVFKIDSFTNEIYRKTYENTYTGDDTDTKQKDIIDNACDFCYRSSSIVGTTTNYNYKYNRAIIYLFWLARFLERQVPYIEPDGKIWTKAYNGLTATGKSWDINNNNQEVFLIDIPGIEANLQGNSGITRNTIRYKNNASTIRPVSATRDPIEQLQGILPLNEFRDTKIEAATEANQLGDNRYNIWSSDIIFLGLRIEGQGYLQPGKTIEIENTGEISISQNDFLIISFQRDPKNDIYVTMVLSDNIIFPTEFKNYHITSKIQINTASVQTIENQGDLTTHAADDAAHHIPPDSFSPIYIEGANGFVRGGLYFTVATSDVNAYITANFTCPETRADWKFAINSYTTPNNEDCSGTARVGVQASGEVFDSDSEYAAENMDLIHGGAGIIKWTFSPVFSATKGDIIWIRWTKDNNPGGGGQLRIAGIYLTY